MSKPDDYGFSHQGEIHFHPKPHEIAASLASDCPMATPRDSRDCHGSACIFWDRVNARPCSGHFERIAAHQPTKE